MVTSTGRKKKKRGRLEIVLFFALMIMALFVYYRGRQGAVDRIRDMQPEVAVELEQKLTDVPVLIDVGITVEEPDITKIRDPFQPR